MATLGPDERTTSMSRRRLLGGAAVVGAAIGVGLARPRRAEGVAEAAPTTAHAPTLLDEITAYAKSALTHVPGCAVASFDTVTGEGGTFATGYASMPANNDPSLPTVTFTPSTVWVIDSVTKAFTGIMLAQAVVQGRGRNGPIRLDDPISTVLDPYLALYGLSMPAPQADVTIRQIANFSSGFPEQPDNRPALICDYTIEGLAEWLSSSPLPGFTSAGPYRYSDVAVDLLGFILADQLTLTAPGEPSFDALLQLMLSSPDILDMPNTFIFPPGSGFPPACPNPVPVANGAVGYLYPSPGTHPHPFDKAAKTDDPSSFSGGGGNLHSSVDDMAHLVRALVTLPTAGALDRAVPLSITPDNGVVQGDHHTGLGWDSVTTIDGSRVVLKNGGGVVGTTTLLGFSPDTGRSLFFMTNVNGADPVIGLEAEFRRLLSVRSDAPLEPASTSSSSTTATTPSSTPVVAPRFTG